jgi:hypothetical protein
MSLHDQLVFLAEGLRLAARRLRPQPVPRYEGSAEDICRQVVAAAWNGTYFRAGQGHLDQFWLRDLAISLEGLLDLGYRGQALSSLRWALGHWARAGRVTTTIFGFRHPADVFTYAADSLPFLLYCIERLEAPELRGEYRSLLAAEAERYARTVIEPATGRVREDRSFSATKDTMRFRGTCFTATMAAWLAVLLERCPELPRPLEGLDLGKALDERFWTGAFYRNDVHTEPALCSADANFWPLWCGVAPDAGAKTALCVRAVVEAGLDRPFPLKYHARRMPALEVPVQRLFLPNYQGDAIWTFFTPQWIELAGTVDPQLARRHVARYRELVEHEGTWVEVFEPDGSRPLAGRFGHGSDHGMIWAASMPRLFRQYPASRLQESR